MGKKEQGNKYKLGNEIFNMNIDDLSICLKNCSIEETTYNRVKDLYLLQSNSFDRIIVFSALLDKLK